MANEFFHIDMLPAREGDCLWIEYGDDTSTHRVVIDGGRQIAWDSLKQRIDALPAHDRKLDLLILTHVDADHIEGFLKMMDEDDLDLVVDDVWFNAFVHLTRPTGLEHFGAKQGERFTDDLIDKVANDGWAWNKAFDRESVVVPDDGQPPAKTLPGGMRVSVLSPKWTGLERLKNTWRREVEAAGMVPSDTPPPEPLPEGMERFGSLNADKVLALAETDEKRDGSRANAASIAVLLEFGGASAILPGDAHADVLLESLEALSPGQPFAVDAFKLSHHGSFGTISRALIDKIATPRVLVSSDGSRHHHPDRETIAQVVVRSGNRIELVGNYESEEMVEWDIAALKHRFDYDVTVPDTANGTIRVTLLE